MFICQHCQEFDWEEVNGLICGNKKCGNIVGVPFCDQFVSRDASGQAQKRIAELEGK